MNALNTLKAQLEGKRSEMLDAGVSPATAGRILYTEINDLDLRVAERLREAGLIDLPGVPMNFGEVRDLILSTGMTYARLSEATGLPVSSLTKYATGHKIPRLVAAERLAMAIAAIPVEPVS